MEYLPDELLLHIFRYLKNLDIICSFNNLNIRFQQIIHPYFSNIDVTRTNEVHYKTIRLFLDNILPLHNHQIQSLTFDPDEQRQIFEPYIHLFTNLKCIILQSDRTRQSFFYGYELEQFLKKILSLKTLTKLSISLKAKTFKFITKYASNNLSSLSLSHPNEYSCLSYDIKMPYIKYFSIVLTNIYSLEKIFEIMINLKELNISLFNDNYFQDNSQQLQIPSSLEKLTIKFGSTGENNRWLYQQNMKWLKDLLNFFKNNLKTLILIGIYTNKEFLNHEILQNLIHNFSQLEIFQYHIHTKDQPEYCLTNMKNLSCLHHSINSIPKEFQLTLSSHSTLKQLFMCTKLQIFNKLLSFYELEDDKYKLINLKKLDCFHNLEDLTSMINEFISKLIRLSPNLQIISIHDCSNTQIIIKWLKQLHFNQCKTIDHFIYKTQTSSNDPLNLIFFNELFKIFPQLKTITIPRLTQYTEENSIKLSTLIEYLRENFIHLIHLKLQMNSFDYNYYIKQLTELVKQNMLHYTIDKRKRGDLLNIFL